MPQCATEHFYPTETHEHTHRSLWGSDQGCEQNNNQCHILKLLPNNKKFAQHQNVCIFHNLLTCPMEVLKVLFIVAWPNARSLARTSQVTT